MQFDEYKVIHVVEGGCGTLLLGSSGIPIKILEQVLYDEAAEGWQIAFQIVVTKRYLILWTREAVIVTLLRKRT